MLDGRKRDFSFGDSLEPGIPGVVLDMTLYWDYFGWQPKVELDDNLKF